MRALLGLGLKLTNLILSWTPCSQTISKQGATAPLSLQFGRRAADWTGDAAAWTGEAAAKTGVRLARVMVAMRTRIEITFGSFRSRPAHPARAAARPFDGPGRVADG